ncbi:MAG: hypothetical protein HC782_00490 [Gammaproteobacteria bacterium]|nr:hypothetical protein [Gammaproteobacteria bacterium]
MAIYTKNAVYLSAKNDLEGAQQQLRHGIALVQKGFDVAVAINNAIQIAENASLLGEYYFLLGEFDTSKTHTVLALAQSREIDYAAIMAESMLYLGKNC